MAQRLATQRTCEQRHGPLVEEQMTSRWWARAHFAKKGHVTEMLMSRLPNPWLQKGEILWILCKGGFLVTHSCWPFHLKFGIELRTKSIVPFVRSCPVLCTFFSLFFHPASRKARCFFLLRSGYLGCGNEISRTHARLLSWPLISFFALTGHEQRVSIFMNFLPLFVAASSGFYSRPGWYGAKVWPAGFESVSPNGVTADAQN